MNIPSAEIVGKETNEAGLEQAIAHNAQVVAETAVNEAAVLEEQTSLHAEEVEAESLENGGILDQLNGSSASLRGGLPKAQGSTEGDVYFKAATDAVVGPLGQACGVVMDVIKDNKDPFAYGQGTTTFDKMIKDGAKKDPLKNMMGGKGGKAGKKGSLFTGEFDEVAGMPARVDGVDDFMKGKNPVKGVKSTKEHTAALSKKLETSHACKVVSQQHLGNAIAMKATRGAENQAAVKVAAYVPGSPATGPTFRAAKEKAVEETQQSWTETGNA